MSGFEILPGTAREVWRIECARVAEADRVPGTMVVPCLGGLSAVALIEAAAAGRRRIRLVHRGWCEACPGGATATPWAASLADAQTAAATVEGVILDVEHLPLPARRALPLPDHLAPQGAVRRSLFRRLTAPTAVKSSPWFAARRVEPRQTLRRAAAITRLTGKPPPASWLPAVTITDRCNANRVCVAACPTSALSVVTDAAGTGIDLDATRCTACGVCAEACPEGAISVAPRGQGSDVGPFRLSRTRQTDCVTCGRRFTPTADQTACAVCEREREVAKLGFALMRRTEDASGDAAYDRPWPPVI
jgi:ferredoxin